MITFLYLQDDDHYDKRDVPSNTKRVKTDESPLGGLPAATPPDPYAAMALYYSKLNAFRPWSPKGGFPPLSGYSLQQPYSGRGTLSEPSQESPSDRYATESPQGGGKRKYQYDKGETKLRLEESLTLPVVEDSRFPSLADEISTVADALTGAPVHAKETVLKILERLTQRLDRAERDRDVALGRYRELQARYDQLEEELSKKRGELRELLRQDSRSYSANLNGRGPAEANKRGALSVIVEAGDEERLSQRSKQDQPPLPEQQTEQKSPVKSLDPSPSPKAESLSPVKENVSSLDEVIIDRSNKLEQELNKKLKVGIVPIININNQHFFPIVGF